MRFALMVVQAARQASDMEQRHQSVQWKLVLRPLRAYRDTVWTVMPTYFLRRTLARIHSLTLGSGPPGLRRRWRGRSEAGGETGRVEASLAVQENRFLRSVADLLAHVVAGVASEDEPRGLVATITETSHRLRLLVRDRRPVALDDGDVVRALQVFLDLTGSDTDPVWSLRSQVRRSIQRPQSIDVYWLVREALTNVRRHARARRADVLMAETGGGILVTVRDDGRGFSPPAARSGPPRAGLAGMRARTELAGGSFRLQSTPGGGTTVEFWLPAAPAYANGHHGVNLSW